MGTVRTRCPLPADQDMEQGMNPEPNTQWRLETKYLVSIGLAVFALFVVYLMRPVLPSLVVAALIAFVASPSIRFLTRRFKIPREAAVAITYLLASILVLIILFVLLPQVVRSANFLVRLDYGSLIDDVRSWAETTLIRLRDNDLGILGVKIVMDQLVDPILQSDPESRLACLAGADFVDRTVFLPRSGADEQRGFRPGSGRLHRFRRGLIDLDHPGEYLPQPGRLQAPGSDCE